MITSKKGEDKARKATLLLILGTDYQLIQLPTAEGGRGLKRWLEREISKQFLQDQNNDYNCGSDIQKRMNS